MNPLDLLTWSAVIAGIIILSSLSLAVAVGTVRAITKPREDKNAVVTKLVFTDSSPSE